MVWAYRLANGLGMLAIASAGAFLLASLLFSEERTLFAWITWSSFFLVILCMESRVRMGYRMKRGALFAFHLATAIPGFLLLSAALFFSFPVYLLSVFLLLGALVSGSLLFYRSWKFHA